MNRLLVLFTVIISLFAQSLRAADATFAGDWDTTYGRMILKASGATILGTYQYGGGGENAISGKVDGRKLTFTYEEKGVHGEGSFTLSEDGQSFAGQWRPQGQTAWGQWSGRRAIAVVKDFSGLWKASYGLMRLVQKGDRVEGCYAYGGRSTITGIVKEDTLSLTYREPSGVTGKAEFKLSADRSAFTGKWKADAAPTGGEWSGSRLEPQPGRVWLIVLEARWEASLRDSEYSYGEMLRQFFTRVPTVAMRHRFFTGKADFAKWCSDLPYINEPIVFYVSSHGTEKGITVGSEILDGMFIGEQLKFAPDVKLVHLGACLAMAGPTPADIRKTSGLAAPVSGYTRTADWAGSAVIDFAYLDLVLSRKMLPGDAVKQIQDSVSFAGEQQKPGSAIAPAGLKIVQ